MDDRAATPGRRSSKLRPIGEVIRDYQPRVDRMVHLARQRKAAFLDGGGQCVNCWDTGVVPGQVDTTNEPLICTCPKGVDYRRATQDRSAAMLLKTSGAARFNLDLATHPNQPLVRACVSWHDRSWASALLRIDDVSAGGDDPFLLLYGAAGVGKSQIAAALLRRAIRRGAVSARFVSLTKLLDDLRPGGPEGARAALDLACSAHAVVLDDLGIDNPTQFVCSKLYQIINDRYERRAWTIITSNKDPYLPYGHDDSLHTWTDDRIYGRIMERSLPVNCGGPERNLRL